MKFKIKGDPPPKEEPVVELSLEYSVNGAVRVVTEAGRWQLVTFETDGTLILHPSISADFGFSLDSERRMVTVKRS